MANYLFVNEYIREDYITQHNDGTVSENFMNKESGKLLKKFIETSGLDVKDFDIAYAYHKIPEPNNTNFKGKILSYKNPNISEAKPHLQKLEDKIVENKYEVVIPTGKLGNQLLKGSTSAITKVRGKPVQVDLEHSETGEKFTTWFLPTFSMEYIQTRVNNMQFVTSDLGMLKQFDDRGEESFLPSKTQYELVTDMDRVREIFDVLENEPISAWDLETNTLNPEMKGSKAIVVVISWKDKQAVCIPIEKKETPFKEEEIEEILTLLNRYVNNDNYKVGANINYDIRFLMSAYGFTDFNNHLDIQTAYYLTVSQEKSVPFGLKDLAYQFTDMGGYDEELDNYKREYIKNYKKENGNKKPVNEIDGSNFNYDWIPLDILFNYAAGDADVTLRIYKELKKKVDTREKWKYLFYDFYSKMSVALARMEHNGLYVDKEYLKVIDKEYTEEVNRLIEEMRELPSVQKLEEENKKLYEAGLKEMEKKPDERNEEIAKLRTKFKGEKQLFNPNSVSHKSRVLFDILKARPEVNKTYAKEDALNKNLTKEDMDNGDNFELYKTDKFTLEEMTKESYPEEVQKLSELLQTYSSVKTLRNKFVEKYPQFISDTEGAIHGRFNPHGTSTSRLSSSNPK